MLRGSVSKRFNHNILRKISWLAIGGTTACADVTGTGMETVGTGDLLILSLQPDAPPPEASEFTVINGRESVDLVVHDDQFNTPFLELRFPAECVDRVGGDPVTSQDTVGLTVAPRSGRYGVDLAPETVGLTAGCAARLTFFFGRWGDLGVADGSETYLDRAAYAAALTVWREVSPDRWEVADGADRPGAETVGAAVTEIGSFILAAPR